MARKKAKSTPAPASGEVRMPNEAEAASIVKALPKQLDPPADKILRALKRLIRLGKLRPEALEGAKVFAVQALDKIESRAEPIDPVQVAKSVDSRYFVGGEKEPGTETELEAEKISRTSGFKEQVSGVDPGPDRMDNPRIQRLLSLAMRGKEGRKSVRSRLLKQQREGVKEFSPDKEIERKKRPPTVGERVAQIVALPREPASAVEEMAGGEYTGKGSRGVPKIADTGGLQRRPRVETGRKVPTQTVREFLPRLGRKQALNEARGRILAEEAGVEGKVQGPLTREQRARMVLEAHQMRSKPQTVERRIRPEPETVPVQGPLRKMPRGPRTQAGKPIQYKFDDSGRPMGMGGGKFEDIRLVEGVPFDKTMYAKLDRLARSGDLGAARVLAKMRTQAFGARKGQEAGEVLNPKTKKTKFKTAKQKARGRALQESRAMGRTASEEARSIMRGRRRRDGGKAEPVRMSLQQAAAAAERQLRMEAGRKAGGRGKIHGPLTKQQLEQIYEVARRMSPAGSQADVPTKPLAELPEVHVSIPKAAKAPKVPAKVAAARGMKAKLARLFGPFAKPRRTASVFEMGGAPRPRFRGMVS